MGDADSSTWCSRAGSVFDEQLVLVVVHEAFQFLGLGELHLDEPPLPVRIDVDQGRVLHDAFVVRADGAGQGANELDDGLLGFELSHRLPLLDELSPFGQQDRQDLAELLLGVIGDPDSRGVAHFQDPEMVLGKREFAFVRHRTFIGTGLVDVNKPGFFYRPFPRTARAVSTLPRGALTWMPLMRREIRSIVFLAMSIPARRPASWVRQRAIRARISRGATTPGTSLFMNSAFL